MAEHSPTHTHTYITQAQVRPTVPRDGTLESDTCHTQSQLLKEGQATLLLKNTPRDPAYKARGKQSRSTALCDL